MRATMIKRIERVGGDRFQVYSRRKGRKRYVGTFESKRQAEAAEIEYQADTQKIERGELPEGTGERRVLRAAADAWLAEIDREQSRSADTYRTRLEKQVYPWLASSLLSSLTTATIKKWRDACRQRYAITTTNSAHATLSAACSWFIEQGWIESNPCAGLERLESKDERLYAWIKTAPEVERLIRSCAGDLRDLVALAVGTGMRIDELLHLQWVDVDLDRRLLTVQRGRKGTTKSGKMRHVPILDGVVPVLRARHLSRGDAILVFPSPTNRGAKGRARGRVRSKQSVHKSFKRALDRAELDASIRFHDLRHTFASHWVLNGGDIFRLSKILGHSSVTQTEQVYAHLCPTAWAQDYGRVVFRLPTEAKVVEFQRADG